MKKKENRTKKSLTSLLHAALQLRLTQNCQNLTFQNLTFHVTDMTVVVDHLIRFTFEQTQKS